MGGHTGAHAAELCCCLARCRWWAGWPTAGHSVGHAGGHALALAGVVMGAVVSRGYLQVHWWWDVGNWQLALGRWFLAQRRGPAAALAGRRLLAMARRGWLWSVPLLLPCCAGRRRSPRQGQRLSCWRPTLARVMPCWCAGHAAADRRRSALFVERCHTACWCCCCALSVSG